MVPEMYNLSEYINSIKNKFHGYKRMRMEIITFSYINMFDIDELKLLKQTISDLIVSLCECWGLSFLSLGINPNYNTKVYKNNYSILLSNNYYNELDLDCFIGREYFRFIELNDENIWDISKFNKKIIEFIDSNDEFDSLDDISISYGDDFNINHYKHIINYDLFDAIDIDCILNYALKNTSNNSIEPIYNENKDFIFYIINHMMDRGMDNMLKGAITEIFIERVVHDNLINTNNIIRNFINSEDEI